MLLYSAISCGLWGETEPLLGVGLFCALGSSASVDMKLATRSVSQVSNGTLIIHPIYGLYPAKSETKQKVLIGK